MVSPPANVDLRSKRTKTDRILVLFVQMGLGKLGIDALARLRSSEYGGGSNIYSRLAASRRIV